MPVIARGSFRHALDTQREREGAKPLQRCLPTVREGRRNYLPSFNLSLSQADHSWRRDLVPSFGLKGRPFLVPRVYTGYTA